MIVALVLSQFSGVGLFSWGWICHYTCTSKCRWRL